MQTENLIGQHLKPAAKIPPVIAKANNMGPNKVRNTAMNSDKGKFVVII
jgi:hypothetical protein